MSENGMNSKITGLAKQTNGKAVFIPIPSTTRHSRREYIGHVLNSDQVLSVYTADGEYFCGKCKMNTYGKAVHGDTVRFSAVMKWDYLEKWSAVSVEDMVVFSR